MIEWSAPELAALEAEHVNIVYFVKLEFDDATSYLHTSIGTYTWGGQDWLGVGALGSIEMLEEAEGFSPFEIALKLSGIDDDLLTIAQDEPLFERRCTIYVGILDENNVLIADPKQRFAGNMQNAPIRIGEENSVLLSVESELKFFRQTNGARWTDEQQQSEFSGDQAFEYLPQIQDATIQWGAGQASILYGDRGAPWVDWTYGGGY